MFNIFACAIQAGTRLLGGVTNIEEKLALVQNSLHIVGIKEGMFVRFYEQSLFGWQQWAEDNPSLPTLKVLRKVIKKLGGREVVYGGVPLDTLTKQGVEVGLDGIVRLEHKIDLTDWGEWRSSQQSERLPNPDFDTANEPRHSLYVSSRYVKVFLPEDLAQSILQLKRHDELQWELLQRVKSAITF